MPEDYTIGIEEEFQLIDRKTRRLAPTAYDRLVAHGGERIREHLHPEFFQCVVESTTDKCESVQQADQQTQAIRSTLLRMAERSGLDLISSGTPPLGNWLDQVVTKDAGGRYQQVADTLQDVGRTLIIFGLHVHVGIADQERRIAALRQVRTYLPMMLALSVNSPFWQGRLTGFHSYRTIVWSPFPLANVPDPFDSLASFNAFEQLMKDAHSLDVPRRIWWDVRPHHTLPTLEFRIADMPINHVDMISLVAYSQALVKTSLDLYDRGQSFPVEPSSIINENKWRVARDGLQAKLVDSASGKQVPAIDLIARSLDAVRQSMQELGTEKYLAHLNRMVSSEYRSGAQRQIEAYMRNKSADDVVDTLIRETARDIPYEAAWPLAEESPKPRAWWNLRKGGGTSPLAVPTQPEVPVAVIQPERDDRE